MQDNKTVTSEKMFVLAEPLRIAVSKNQVAHAYLFCGEKAFDQAELLAMTLVCLNPLEGQPCGKCANCRKITDGNFADVHIVSPDNNFIRIDRLKKMRAEANLRSYQGGKKVFIIDSADCMKDEAANSLLKILEEPPEDTVFILCAEKTQGILPTILSRCQLHIFGEQVGFFVAEEQINEMMPRAEDFFFNLPKYSLAKLLVFSQCWHKEKESLIIFLSALLRLLYDNLKYEVGPFSRVTALEAALFCERAIDLLMRNINQRLLCDVFFICLWRWVAKKT